MLTKLKTYFLDLSVIQKLSIFYTLVIVTIVIVVYSYFPENSRNQQIKMITRRVELATEFTSLFLQHSFETKDFSLLKDIVTPLNESKEISFYFIADNNGKLLQSNRNDLIKKYVTDITNDTLYLTKDNLYIVKVRPIITENKVVGYLAQGITLQQVNDYIANLKYTIFIFVFLILIIGLSSIMLFTNFIFKPLIDLKRNINEISAGNYTSRIGVNRNDEIGVIINSFNKMAENLDLTSQKLKVEISQRQNTEDELIMTQQSLYKSLEKQKELNLLKSRFISMISHEYRTPLTTISNSTYLLEQYSQKGDMKNVLKFSGMINSSVKRMTELLEDVLKVSRDDRSQLEMSLVEVDLNDFVNDICEEFKLVDHFKHTFEMNLNCKTIKIEAKLLQLILRNLISNSIKYSTANTVIKISSSIIDNQLIVKIKDNGIGISENDLANLFVPFHRGENVGAIEGTGLGMAIIKDSVELLLGEISVESKTGEGSFTEFTLSFPLINNSMMLNPNI